jgi:HPt (histidine-containing phosphotransfer) domain-containing protein
LPPCSTSERNLVSPQIKEKQETVVVTIENKNIFDKHAALESIDGDTDLFRDMIELFLAKSPDLLDTILKSIEAGDHLQIERSAHALKGSVSHFFASSVYEAVLELEELGRNNGDIMTAMELFSVLQQKMIQLREVMTLQVDI